MADLSAASEEDVKDFFRLYYAPNNATLAVVVILIRRKRSSGSPDISTICRRVSPCNGLQYH